MLSDVSWIRLYKGASTFVHSKSISERMRIGCIRPFLIIAALVAGVEGEEGLIWSLVKLSKVFESFPESIQLFASRASGPILPLTNPY